ncbi:MAG TPA: recombinase family protein [Symbiobacteriaceae bacterium]|jgi:site-specific DNA recombinase|nr:recombinase family protein [Symbiobacteriaceae bacterium]
MIVARCYLRVSTEEQAQSGYSMAAQRDKLDLFCQLQGYAVGGWYRDEGVSAKDLDRPDFQRMMKEAQDGDVIVVYKLDRLTRSVRDLDDLLHVFDDRKLHFRSVTEQFDTTTATGRLMIRMVGEFAQWERETIAERTALGKQKKAQAGEWNGGNPPIGYMAAPSGKTKGGRQLMQLVPDPKLAHLIPMIFERYLSGAGVRVIARWLNEEMGARTPKGAQFSDMQVKRIVTNPVYVGDMAFGDKTRGKRRVQGTHEPLISREVFDQAQEVFGRRKLMAPRQATGIYVLSGIARCGVCKGPLIAGRRPAGHNYMYRCMKYIRGQHCGPIPLPGVSGPIIEGKLVEAISRLTDPETLDSFYSGVAKEHELRIGLTDTEVRRLRQDLTDSEAAIRRWDHLYEIGQLETDEYVKRVNPHRERIKALRTQLETVANAPALPPKEELARFAFSFREIWNEAEPEERKMLVQHFTAAWGVTPYVLPGRRLVLVAGNQEPPPVSVEPGVR